MRKNRIKVVGCGIGDQSISEDIRGIVESSDILAGGRRLLELFPGFKGQRKLISSDVNKLLGELKRLSRAKSVTVLASGDPLFFGIGGTMSGHFAADELEVIPNISAMQSLFARFAIPWECARFFSVHGNKRINLRAALSSPLAIIYCDSVTSASSLAAKIVARFPESRNRPAIFAENLGMAGERVLESTLGRIARAKAGGLSVLGLLPSDGISDPGIALGLPDDEFVHESNMITHPEIRAVAVSKLRLGPGVMWDIGAGSGSVGIEAACICPELEVHAVEAKPGRAEHIRCNAEEFGLSRFFIHEADCLKAMSKLPRPRSVFIGGGGDDIARILKKSFDRLLDGGRIVVAAILLETRAKLVKALLGHFLEAVSISVSRSKNVQGKRILKADNTIELFVFEKKTRK